MQRHRNKLLKSELASSSDKSLTRIVSDFYARSILEKNFYLYLQDTPRRRVLSCGICWILPFFLLNSHAFRQIPRFIDIAAAEHGDVVRQQL